MSDLTADFGELSLNKRKRDNDIPEDCDVSTDDDDDSFLSDITEVEEEVEEDSEEVVEMTEEEMLRLMDQEEDPLLVCRRLMKPLDQLSASMEILTMKHWEKVYQDGFCVLDDLLLHEHVISMRKQIESVFQETSLFQPAYIKPTTTNNRENGNDDGWCRDVRGDFITWLHRGSDGLLEKITKPAFAIVDKIHNDLQKLIHLNNYCEHQLAYYPAKGTQKPRYEKHRDAFPTDDEQDMSQRRVTVIIYLNDLWSEHDGGCLSIYLRDQSAYHIEPRPGRVVLFLSGVLDHAVEQCFRDRVALTTWFR